VKPSHQEERVRGEKIWGWQITGITDHTDWGVPHPFTIGQSLRLIKGVRCLSTNGRFRMLVRREKSFFGATKEEAEAKAAPFVAATSGRVYFSAPVLSLAILPPLESKGKWQVDVEYCEELAEAGRIIESATAALRLPPILGLCRGGGLPLHVGNRVGSAARQRPDMVSHIAGACAGRATRRRASVQFLEFARDLARTF
jgi:hypothetical protein